jgi:hypothetical protein
MPKPEVKETYVYQWKPDKGETWYLAIKHKETLTGWDWTYGLVTRMQEAWQGPLPCSPRLIISNLSVPMKLADFEQVHVKVSTCTVFELLRPPVHEQKAED